VCLDPFRLGFAGIQDDELLVTTFQRSYQDLSSRFYLVFLDWIGREHLVQLKEPEVFEPIIPMGIFFLEVKLHPDAVPIIVVVDKVDFCGSSVKQIEGLLKGNSATFKDGEPPFPVSSGVLLILVHRGIAIQYIIPLAEQFEMDLCFRPNKM